jgi:hypothetical protein
MNHLSQNMGLNVTDHTLMWLKTGDATTKGQPIYSLNLLPEYLHWDVSSINTGRSVQNQLCDPY